MQKGRGYQDFSLEILHLVSCRFWLPTGKPETEEKFLPESRRSNRSKSVSRKSYVAVIIVGICNSLHLEFSKISYRVEKLQTHLSVENFGACNGLLVNFDALNSFANFRRLWNQQISDAINGQI